MTMVRINRVKPLREFIVELDLSNGQCVQRDLAALLTGPAFVEVRRDQAAFREVRVEAGGLVWPTGADLCPDAVLWGDLPEEEGPVPANLRVAIASPSNSVEL